MKTLLATTVAVAALMWAADANAQGRRPTPTPTATPGSGSPWVDVGQPAAAREDASSSALAAPAGDPVTYRPLEKSIAIGAGYTIGAAAAGELLWNPNTVSARYRFASGLAIEPIAGAVISNTQSKVDTAKTTSSSTDVFIGANVRKPIWRRSQADAVLIIGANLESSSDSTKDPAGGKTTSSGMNIGAGYGVGVEFWPRTHWSFSFDATTQVLGLATTNSKDPAGVKSSSSTTTLSPAFDPTVRIMTHLYY